MSYGWCCWLVVALVMIAAFGHLLWVGAAAVLNVLFGTSQTDAARRRPEPRPYSRCPACTAAVEDVDRHCPECDLLLDSRLARDLHRVRVAEREIRGLIAIPFS